MAEERIVTMPFDTTGVTRGPDGIKRYGGLPASLVHMLRDTVERHPAAEALAETGGGPRLAHRERWGRAARGAGGLRAAGGRRGGRVGRPRGDGADWGLRLSRAALGGGAGVT